MPIASSDLLYCYSGGTANSTPGNSLGGTKSNITISDSVMNALFDDVTAQEATDGDSEYRGIFLMNSHSTLTLSSPKIWISASTTAPGDEWYIWTDSSGINTNNTMSSVSNESTEPTGASGQWTAFGTTLSINDMGPTKSIGLWIKRSVSVGAASYASDSASLAFSGETA